VARAEGLGRPLLYGTTRRFLEHFGFRSLEDLPRPDELPVVLRSRAVVAPEPVTTTDGAPPPEPVTMTDGALSPEQPEQPPESQEHA